MAKAMVAYNPGYGFYVRKPRDGSGGPFYLREDMTWHEEMCDVGGTYFKHVSEAEALCDKWNNKWGNPCDTPKIWRDMTPEERGALLLAEYEGKVIEAIAPCNPSDCWEEGFKVGEYDDFAYRAKPEPKRKTVTLYCDTENIDEDPMPIGTIDLIDGGPDWDSIKRKRINE